MPSDSVCHVSKLVKTYFALWWVGATEGRMMMMAIVPTMCHTVEMALNQPISRVDRQFSSPWQTRIPADDDVFRV